MTDASGAYPRWALAKATGMMSVETAWYRSSTFHAFGARNFKSALHDGECAILWAVSNLTVSLSARECRSSIGYGPQTAEFRNGQSFGARSR